MATTIAVTGKGGVGKTTIAALIVRHLRAKAGGAILALDADPDSNLATVLGVQVETTIGDLREDVLKQMADWPAGMSKEAYVEAGLHQIIVETPKVDLIAMGRGEGPGCYCFINNLLRKFADELMPCYEWIVMDNEAGMEHLSRRTASRIDHLIVVVNGGPLAIDSARRIDRLLLDLGRDVRGKYLVLNAVRPDRQAEVLAKLAETDLEFLGSVPRDEALEEALFRGDPIYALEDTPAVGTIGEMMQRIGAG
jgi:CO dehydrogenase maturation factor